MPNLTLATVLLVLAGLFAPAAGAREPDLGEAERLVVEQTNELRRSQGLAPTVPQRHLIDAARGFANFMARTDRYAHDADGRQPAQRAGAQGYDYCMVAENIAYHYSSADFRTEELARGFVQGWKKSPEHRRNMLAPDATDIGVAVARSPRSGRYYAVQMFGRPQALRVEFRIVNRSPTVVSYEIDGRRFQLPPRTTGTHQQCNAPRLAVQLPGEREPALLRPANGERYAVEHTAGRYRVRRV
jgi:uncharacterized protein YkwD